MAKVFLRFFLVLILCYSTLAQAFDIYTEARDQEWLGRLFYVNGKSLVRNKDFFISPEGRNDPVKELKATIELIEHGGSNFACLYPGRYSYLAPKLNLKKISCPDFEAWRDSFETSGLSVMFASQYLENPASSFGHTYLKVNSKTKSLYLNKVISFAANVPENIGGGEYIWKGLTGGFQGIFDEHPFYILYQEYANMEKRDVWEYELNISEEATVNLLATLYEVIFQAKFDYLFLSDNCSSLLLRLLDIEFKKSLHKSLPFYVIPIETVKVLQSYGLVKKSIFHPSITSRMSVQIKTMKFSEIDKITKYIHKNEKLPDDSTAATLDLGLEYLNFRRQKSGGVLIQDMKDDFNRYILLRSRTPTEHQANFVETPNPLKASYPQRLSLGVQRIKGDPLSGTISYRPLGKDFNDRPNGYAKESEINLLKTKLLLNAQETKASWFNIDVIGIRKFADYNIITKNVSWGGNLSLKSFGDQKCSGCYFTEIDSHLGLGKDVFRNSMLVYLVFHPTIRVGNISHNVNLLPQLEGGIIKSTEDYVWKSSAFYGLAYDGYDKKYFRNIKNSFSWFVSDKFSLNLWHDYFYQNKKTLNSLESGGAFYF